MATAAIGVVALAGGCGWPTVPNTIPTRSSNGTPGAGVAVCTDAALTPAVRNGQGSGSIQRFTVVLTNRGKTACTVYGYPVLVLRNAQGQVLPPAYPRGESKKVTLPAGRSATATMTVTPSACGSAPLAATAAVIPPNGDASTTLPVRIPVCRPTISPVVG